MAPESERESERERDWRVSVLPLKLSPPAPSGDHAFYTQLFSPYCSPLPPIDVLFAMFSLNNSEGHWCSALDGSHSTARAPTSHLFFFLHYYCCYHWLASVLMACFMPSVIIVVLPPTSTFWLSVVERGPAHSKQGGVGGQAWPDRLKYPVGFFMFFVRERERERERVLSSLGLVFVLPISTP